MSVVAKRGLTIIIPALLLAAVPIWIWVIAPRLMDLPKDFSYSAEVFSLDDFYDEVKGEFSGEKRSVTKFSYETTGEEGGILTIKNVFDVRTVGGDPIFSVERLYGIDRKTGMHVRGHGDRDREGYLFAPRHLKEGQPYTYWHANYDGPAHLQFVAREDLFGLPVFRYETRYEGVPIDQTGNLGNQPGVGKTRGVDVEPYLQIWIEPVSGHLVKYQDDTTAYFYDLKTGERLHPWNHFGNTFTRASVLEQVGVARLEKIRSIAIELVTPGLMALLALVLLVSRYRRNAAMLILLTGGLGFSALLLFKSYPLTEVDTIKIGIARWTDNPAYVQNIAAFKEALDQAGYIEGMNVTYVMPPVSDADADKHRQVIQSLVDQRVDLIYSLNTPGTLIAKEVATEIPIVFSVVTYPVESGIISSLRNSRNNLVGTRNWVPTDDQLSVFLELVPKTKTIGFVHKKAESNSTIQFEEMRQAALQRGIRLVEIAPTRVEEITPLLQGSRSALDALYLACDALIHDERAEAAIVAFDQKERLPDFACNESAVRLGSLIGTVNDFAEMGKLAGEKAGLIIQGATPQSLETNTVTRPFIYLNQTMARSLGIVPTQHLLLRVKEVVD